MRRPPDFYESSSRNGIPRRRFLGGLASLATLAMIPRRVAAGVFGRSLGQMGSSPAILRVDTTRAVNAFDPDQSLGSSMDSLSPDLIKKIYTPEMVKLCLSTGWGPITYRNHTELAIQAWHWNHNGTWSDPAHQRGYFVGNAEPTDFLHDSFAYDLPHRGSTRNGGASEGCSRLTDGDPTTFWKSNPYLTQNFTGEDDALHPQWIILDLQAEQQLNALRIDWCEPSARAYQVQYWTGGDPMTWEAQYSSAGAGAAPQVDGRWNQFPNGSVQDGKGGSVTLKLSEHPITTRWIRVVMTQSSNQPGPHGADDVRHRVGYAIYQVYAGMLQPDDSLVDLVKHSPDQNQTPTYASSNDCYHSAADLAARGDQTGFDLFFTSGITNQLPAMIPVAVVFSTPEDAANQIAYLKKRGYPVAWVEMGEECDGQYMMPEDYAALYIQFANAIHKVDPEMKLGGPVFQGINRDVTIWPDAQGRTSWFGRFLDYLKSHGHIQDLAFVSFEHYPFDPCTVNWSDLYREPELTRSCLDALRNDGLPDGIPLMNTESNVSWDMTQYMSDIFSGLWLADSVGSFFLHGGAAYYHSPIQPQPPNRGCHGYATWSNFICDRNLHVTGYTAEYYVGQMINKEWVTHRSGMHHLFHVNGTVEDGAGHALVTAYAVRRPDDDWALLLINKDQQNAHTIRVAFENGAGTPVSFVGPVHMVAFGSEQYVWHGGNAQAHADPDDPPRTLSMTAGRDGSFVLPQASVTVLRGKIQASV